MGTTHTLRKQVESRHALLHRKKTLVLGVAIAALLAGAVLLAMMAVAELPAR
jgi:hypothetical protein